MAKDNKYRYRLAEDGATWTAEIIRKISSRAVTVSKSQAGFSSESEAQAWAEHELKVFVKTQSERNKRRSKSPE